MSSGMDLREYYVGRCKKCGNKVYGEIAEYGNAESVFEAVNSGLVVSKEILIGTLQLDACECKDTPTPEAE